MLFFFRIMSLIYPTAKSCNLHPVLLFIPYPNRHWLLCVRFPSLLKTLGKEKKMLITSNFCFSQSVFLQFWRTFHLGVCVHYLKSNPYYQGRQFKMHFSFRIMFLFRVRLFIFYQAPHSQKLSPPSGALV